MEKNFLENISGVLVDENSSTFELQTIKKQVSTLILQSFLNFKTYKMKINRKLQRFVILSKNTVAFS